MRRTVLRSPLQFLTMVLILGLASTLLSGLYASHLTFKDQINWSYETSNIADITSTLTYDSDNFNEQEVKDDYQKIKNIVGDAGTVETQYVASAHIHGLDASIVMSDAYPTINKPFDINGKAENDDYLLFSCKYLNIALGYGERSSWIDDDGNYQEIEIDLGIASLKNRINDPKKPDLKTKLNHYLRDGGKNLFDNDYFTMKVTPTGNMEYAENLTSNSVIPYSFITTRKFINRYLYKTLKDNYDVEQLKIDLRSDPSLQECYDILRVDEDNEIMNRYWCNNRCVTRLNDRNDASKYRDKINTAFKDKTNNNLLLNVQLTDTLSHQQLNTDMIQSVQLCYVFPPLFFLVAILIVLTTISQIILKERKEIGTLKAIGASNRSIYSYYIILACIVSLIGVAIGLVAGPLLLPMILNVKYKMLYNLPPIHYIFPTVMAIVMTFIVLLIASLVAYLVARKEVKSLPIVSMRPKVVNIKHKNISDSKQDNTHKLCFKMAIRNIFCSIPRSVMVIVGVLGCTALLCCGFGIDDSIQYGINNDTNMFFNTDSLIYFSNQSAKEGIEKMQSDGTLTAVEAYGYLPVSANKSGITSESFSTYVYSLDKYSERTNKFFNIGYEPHEDKIAVTSKVAKNLNLHVGNYLTFNFLGKAYVGIVEKIIDTFYIHGIFVDGTYPQLPMVSRYPTCAYARFNKDLDQQEVINRIRAIPGVSNAVDKATLTSRVDEISSSLSYITVTIKVFAILLAIVSIYNLALLNFKENMRNIATMKVLGFNRREVAESLFFEIITLSAIGTLIGLTLGYPLTLLTLGINQVPMCEFLYYLGPLSILFSLLISLGVSAIINSFVGMRNKSVKMVESLKSVE